VKLGGKKDKDGGYLKERLKIIRAIEVNF